MQINCLNLCEILPYLQKKRSIQQVIADAMKAANYATCERIYIGTSFCGKYFLHQQGRTLSEVFHYCRENEMHVTLVIPTFSEGDLVSGKSRVDQILRNGADIVDEVTVNDFGMLDYISKTYRKEINLGRLFMKDYRDPRYEEYFQIPWKPKMFTQYLKAILRTYSIRCCEFDITHKCMDFSDVPEAILPSLHVPFCYQTVGRICEYASISKEIAKKFRPNDLCDEKCAENYVTYTEADGKLEYIRFGRTIYFKHPGYEFIGLKRYRLLYYPIDLLKASVEGKK